MELEKYIVTTTRDVFGTMVMMDIEPEPPDSSGQTVIDSNVTGALGFAGDLCGMLSIHCPTPVALSITGNMLGLELTELDDDVKDAISEIANMLAGGIKSEFSAVGMDLQLSIPNTIIGRSYRVKSSSNSLGLVVPFMSENGRFWVELKYIAR